MATKKQTMRILEDIEIKINKNQAISYYVSYYGDFPKIDYACIDDLLSSDMSENELIEINEYLSGISIEYINIINSILKHIIKYKEQI